jgi:protein phosphatase
MITEEPAPPSANMCDTAVDFVLQEPSEPPSVRSFGRTDPGRVRPSNQDHFLISEMARTMWVHRSSLPQPEALYGSHRAHVFVVADGMGGHSAGEVASALTVATLETFMLNVLHRFSNLRRSEEKAVAEEFQEALHQARSRLLKECAHHPEFSGMGTTLTMAFSSDWKLFVVHAGDSRCYLFRAGKLKQLTNDHTVVGELVRRGALRPEEVSHHAYRHVVTNAVGGFASNMRVEIHKKDLQAQDVILLCTDGLTEMVSEERMTAILQAETDPQMICDRLIGEANDNGGRDNITVVVGRLE